MELKLTRPICFFDLETTGIDVALGGSFVKRVADYLEAFDVNRDF